MASQYLPDAHHQEDASDNNNPTEDAQQSLQEDYFAQMAPDQDRQNFARNIDWASF